MAALGAIKIGLASESTRCDRRFEERVLISSATELLTASGLSYCLTASDPWSLFVALGGFRSTGLICDA
jgi:hypothetical protein